MEGSSWDIELQCSQCGASVSLAETDRLLSCPYCHVRLYLWTSGQFCYCLPARNVSSENLIFIPYWRFKGVVYSVIPFEVQHRILDTTLHAHSHPKFPATLGIQPQALKMRFASSEIQGKFIKPQMPLEEAVVRIQSQYEKLEKWLMSLPPFEREFIGEVKSLIFFPVFVRNGEVVDGILGKVVGSEKDLALEEALSGVDDRWQIRTLPTLCPNCGNMLQGGRESLLLYCMVCNAVWNPSPGSWVAGNFKVMPGKGDSEVYLPFWRMRVAVKGMELKSYADLARAANLPKMIQSEWENQEFYFWIPAFKVHPNLFLRISKQMTLFQQAEELEAVLPRALVHPVTFSEENAAASLKIHLANLLTKKGDYFPKLSEIAVQPIKTTLVFVPFESTGSELIHPQLGVGLQRKVLSL